MEPRARVSVWPGRRRVPGIVAPDSWGARGAECLPRDVLRHTLPAAVSLCNGPTACHGLCHRHGSGTTEARPPASSVPPAPHGGLGALSRHLVNSGPDFRSSASLWDNSVSGTIRCQFIIIASLAWDNSVSVHHYCFPCMGQFGVGTIRCQFIIIASLASSR